MGQWGSGVVRWLCSGTVRQWIGRWLQWDCEVFRWAMGQLCRGTVSQWGSEAIMKWDRKTVGQWGLCSRTVRHGSVMQQYSETVRSIYQGERQT